MTKEIEIQRQYYAQTANSYLFLPDSCCLLPEINISFPGLSTNKIV